MHNPIHATEQCIATIAALARAHRLDGHSVSDNPQIQGDYLEQAVWNRMRALLEDRDHYLQRGIGRLIDSYAEG